MNGENFLVVTMVFFSMVLVLVYGVKMYDNEVNIKDIEIAVEDKTHEKVERVNILPIYTSRTIDEYYVVSDSEKFETDVNTWTLIKEGQKLEVRINGNNKIVKILNVADDS